jgi:hypothetical protein
MQLAKGIRAVAVFEAAKGALVLLAGFGLLSLVQRDVQQFAHALTGHLHLGTSHRYSQLFLDALTRLDDRRLW